MSSDEDDFKHRIGGARPSVGRKHAASPAQFSLRSSKKLNTASLGGLIPAVLRPLPHNVLPEGRAQLRALFSGRQHDGSAGGAAPAAGGQCEWQSNAVEYATGSADAWEDLAAAAVDAEGPDGPDVEIDLLQSDDDSGSTSSTAQEEEQQQQQATDGDPGGGAAALLSWLAERGLEKYGADFSRAGATLALLPCLTDVDLQQIGIVALGARKKVLLGAAELAAPAPAPPAARAVASGAGHFGALAASFGIASYFAAPPQPEGNTPAATGGGSILRFLRGPDGQAPKAPLGAPQALAASKALYKKGAKEWAHSGTTAARGGGGQRGGRPAAPQPFKSWQLVAGTSFVVDRFNNLPPTPPQQCHWFLTHFHADHYKGLTSKFDRGTIYCTPITAALVRQQLRVPPARLQEVRIGGAVTLEGVRATFLDANHCPGAAMLLFERPGRRAVLHTGDCRLTAAARAMPQLEAVRGEVDLVLDTTYCDPQYAFPPQPEVLQFAIDAVKAEAFNPKTLFLFGSYTIGKERLYLEAARVTGRKVYVSATKKKVLDCLALPPDYAQLLTTDDTETNLHAVPLWMVTQKNMANALRHYRGRFASVVGFQPTGWTHQKDAAPNNRRGRRCQKGTIITYQVPYSEHSSFDELVEFVAWLRPTSILPHVNNDGGGPKAQRMVALLRGQAQ